MDWWYAEDGGQVGPYSEDDFGELIRNGTVKADTLVWREGLENWMPLADVPSPPAAPDAAPATAEQPAAPDAERAAVAMMDTSTCAECGRRFSTEDMIRFEDVTVCAECKPVFFQRIQEGADAPVTGGMGETPNAELMTQARNRLDGKWGLAIGTCMAYFGIVFAISFGGAMVAGQLAANVAQLLLVPPLEFGLALFFITLHRQQGSEIGQLFKGFNRYGASIGTFFFRNLIIRLATLVAMVPGIILFLIGSFNKTPSLVVLGGILMTPGLAVAIVVGCMFMWPMYILVDEQGVGIFEAINRSRLMMRGMKWKLFCLGLRFTGWIILCAFTLGIGLIFLMPYMSASYAAFYDDTRGRMALAA